MSSVSGAHRDSRIEGLGGARGLAGDDGVRLLGVDSVTEVSSDVVGSVSGERMGEGPGKGVGMDPTEVTDTSEDTTERLATDSGSGIRAGVLVVDKVRVVPTGELVVEEDGG